VKKNQPLFVEMERNKFFLKSPLFFFIFAALFQTDMKKTRHPPTCSRSRACPRSKARWHGSYSPS